MDVQVFVSLLGGAASIAVAIVSALILRRKGLPNVEAQIRRRTKELVDTLGTDLDARIRDLESCRVELGQVKINLARTDRELSTAKRDLRNTEFELLDLYRETGRKPPRRLEEHDNRA